LLTPPLVESLFVTATVSMVRVPELSTPPAPGAAPPALLAVTTALFNLTVVPLRT
jgi:TRAP-type C4-dicarboxylate transport system permease large subunit